MRGSKSRPDDAIESAARDKAYCSFVAVTSAGDLSRVEGDNRQNADAGLSQRFLIKFCHGTLTSSLKFSGPPTSTVF